MNVLVATIVNVPEEVNVCIVCPPLVVIVPHVELVDIQSLQSVAYDTITIPLHQLYHAVEAALDAPPQPQPVFAVPALPFHTLYDSPLPQPHVPPNPLLVYQPQPHPPYVTALHDIELEVPFHHAPALLAFATHHALHAPHPPAVPFAFAAPQLFPSPHE